MEEFNDIWDKAPKFPDVQASDVDRVDVDSFVQIYRDIDDMFEDEDDDNDKPSAAAEKENSSNPTASASSSSSATATATVATRSDTSTVTTRTVSAAATPAATMKPDEDEVDEDDETMEAELESIFESLCDKNKLISKDTVKAWDEVSKLMEDGLLGDEEFEDLWRKTKKSPGSKDQIDVDGF